MLSWREITLRFFIRRLPVLLKFDIDKMTIIADAHIRKHLFLSTLISEMPIIIMDSELKIEHTSVCCSVCSIFSSESIIIIIISEIRIDKHQCLRICTSAIISILSVSNLRSSENLRIKNATWFPFSSAFTRNIDNFRKQRRQTPTFAKVRISKSWIYLSSRFHE